MNKIVPHGFTLDVIERKIRKGHGEWVSVTFTDLTDDDEPVEVTNQYYIGKMTLGQTGTIVSVIAAIFINGASFKEITGRRDNIAFLNVLDEGNLAALFGTILGESDEWVSENFDLTWAVDVLAAFLSYNRFFDLLDKVMNLLNKWGISEDQARRMAEGGAAEPTPTTGEIQ